MVSIGSASVTARQLFQRFGLTPFRRLLTSEDFAAVSREVGVGNRRRRVLIPEVVSWLMMYVGLQRVSMTQGILQAWGHLRTAFPWINDAGVSEEAFCQARRRLTLRFWRGLWTRVAHRYEQRFAPALLWKGKWRVPACDGSDVNLPNAPGVAGCFGRPKNGTGTRPQPQGRLVALCSVFTGFCLAFKFVPLRITEHAALQHLIRCLQENDLTLLDRGFFSLRRDARRTPTPRALPHAPLESGRRIRPTPAHPRTR